MEQLLCQKSVYDALKYYLGRYLLRYWDRTVLVADVKKSYLHSIKVKSFESAYISIIRTSADCVIAACNGSVDWIDADVRNLCHYWPLCALRDQSAKASQGSSAHLWLPSIPSCCLQANFSCSTSRRTSMQHSQELKCIWQNGLNALWVTWFVHACQSLLFI